MSKFSNMTHYRAISDAIAKADLLLSDLNTNMLIDVSLKQDWRYDSGDGPSIAKKLLAKHPPLYVYTYRPWYAWSSAIGYSDGISMYINVRKIGILTHEDLVANIIHEYAHHVGYHHGNNYKTAEKCTYSVPYYLSENLPKWL